MHPDHVGPPAWNNGCPDVLSVSTISAGSGYQYLIKEVVSGAGRPGRRRRDASSSLRMSARPASTRSAGSGPHGRPTQPGSAGRWPGRTGRLRQPGSDRGGAVEEMEEAGLQQLAGRHPAGQDQPAHGRSNEQAAALSSRARVELVRLGLVEAVGVPLADANRAGIGDRVVTRRNDWELSATDRAVAKGPVDRRRRRRRRVPRVHCDGAPGGPIGSGSAGRVRGRACRAGLRLYRHGAQGRGR